MNAAFLQSIHMKKTTYEKQKCLKRVECAKILTTLQLFSQSNVNSAVYIGLKSTCIYIV